MSSNLFENISKISKNNEEKLDISEIFSENSEKEDFLRFLETLQADYHYQNTITMFTIMYYYQKKNKK